MDTLFQEKLKRSGANPLADRMRPQTLSEVLGQEHLVSDGAPLYELVKNKSIHSMILWGPPGVGKTTLALVLANELDYEFIQISAVESGVKQVREVISKAKKLQQMGKPTILFIDEIHRFNKSQQDALLHSVEKGIITLIGATTENPSFEVNGALLSRCQVYKLQPLSNDDIDELIQRSLNEDQILKDKNIELMSRDMLLDVSAGDARTALNAIELSVKLSNSSEKIIIDKNLLGRALQQKTAKYDKKGENHYDTISAFIKSLRGSDPDAAMFWMAKMLDAGEDPKFIARRMVIFASEDIGNADVYALTLAISVFNAVSIIGMPEARINLAQGVSYLASCPKSNASYLAVDKALADIRNGVPQMVPLHLRNAPTKLMKEEGYGKDYKYPHSFKGNFVPENYFPEDLGPVQYYKPGNFGKEKLFTERLKILWQDRDYEN